MLAAELALVRGGPVGARWIEPGDLHVTLRFIGDVEAGLARDIDALLAGLDLPPVAVTLDGLAAFGGAKPRSLIATVRAEAPLLALQAEVERLVCRAGAAPEARRFTPHVTLARLRGVSARAVADALAARGFFSPRGFTAARVALMSARDSVGGGPYRVEAAYPLEAAPQDAPQGTPHDSPRSQ